MDDGVSSMSISANGIIKLRTLKTILIPMKTISVHQLLHHHFSYNLIAKIRHRLCLRRIMPIRQWVYIIIDSRIIYFQHSKCHCPVHPPRLHLLRSCPHYYRLPISMLGLAVRLIITHRRQAFLRFVFEIVQLYTFVFRILH